MTELTTTIELSFALYRDRESTAIYAGAELDAPMVGYVGDAVPGWFAVTTDEQDQDTAHGIHRHRAIAEQRVLNALGITVGLSELPPARMRDWRTGLPA